MSFFLGLSFGCLLGFFLACFCIIAAKKVQELSTEAVTQEEMEQIIEAGRRVRNPA